MSSTRAEILAALAAHEEGLTSKELAPLCPSGECDEMVVGRAVGKLRSEEEIHAVGLRDGATIYKLGAPERQEEVEHITLPESAPARAPQVSEAARAIAAMRQPKVAVARAPGSGVMPATTPPPVQRLPHHEEKPMSKEKSVTERVVDALTKYGKLGLEDLAKRAETTKATLYTMIGTLQKKHGVVRVERGVYALRGQAAPPQDRKPPKPQLKKIERRAPARTARPETPKANGAGPHFAINEHGELGIDAGEHKVSLNSSSFARLREFIERTKSVWEVVSA